MYLIAGLGNPGPEYESTRHNIGFLVIDEIVSSLSLQDQKPKSRSEALVVEASYQASKLILAKPQTFMNNSGQAISSLLSWYKIPASHLIVVQDDLDLEKGQIRIKEGGGSGGHRGIESLIALCPSPDFIRVRVGLGRPDYNMDPKDYVLQKIGKDEKDVYSQAVIRAKDAVFKIISSSLSQAMNEFNQ